MQLIEGDTLTVLKTLKDNSIDLGVTSPPYNKGMVGSDKSIFGPIKYDVHKDNLNEEEYQQQQIEVLNELFRVIKAGGSFFYNHKLRYKNGTFITPLDWLRKSKWTIRQEITWDRNVGTEISGYRFYQVDEKIYWLYKPIGNKVCGERLLGKHARLKSVWRFPPDNRNKHPAPFPMTLPLRCILSILDIKGGTVIDPYHGSGSTAIACKLLNKEYIGIDISKKYLKESRKRIDNYEYAEEELIKELRQHIVTKSYKDRKKEKNER
jgi:site-specific DNA-methyltransferase (adenine-specific)